MNAVVEDWIIIGCFGRVHGLKGDIKVHSYTEPYENIMHYKPWYGFINNQWQLLEVLKIESRNDFLLVCIEGYTNRTQAEILTNVDIGIPSDQLPSLDQGEFYWHQLIGMQVINIHNKILGLVIEILPTGSNDVLVIEGDQRILIPYLYRFIMNVDLIEKKIKVDWD